MNELLLIVENYKGLCEHNFLSTFEELAQTHMDSADPITKNNLSEAIVKTAGSTNKWHTFYITCDKSLDIRACVDHSDLESFLTGKFNDTVENREMRLPNLPQNNDWYWSNELSRFSPKALDIVSKEYPNQFALIGVERPRHKPSLANVIAKATLAQERSSHIHRNERNRGLHNSKEI